MKVGIVVPYSWSFWGAVVEHAELQAEALHGLGLDVRAIMGNDPPGSFTRVLHPRLGRHGNPPSDVIPVGRSVIVPANSSLPNIVLSPRTVGRVKRALEREQFDVLHLHEPMTPAICIAALSFARCPVVATFHAAGELGWMRLRMTGWGFLMDRIDHRIAVSEQARDAAAWLPGACRIVPNGVLIPSRRLSETASAGSRSSAATSRARTTGAAADVARRPSRDRRAAAADRRRPLAVSLLQRRLGVSSEGIDVLGFLDQDELTRELLAAKALSRAVARRRELRDGADAGVRTCALPVVASDITGYRDVTTPKTSVTVRRATRRRSRAGADRAAGRASAALAGSGRARLAEREYVGLDRGAAARDLRARRRRGAGRGARVIQLPRRTSVRILIVLGLLGVAVGMLWWQGPEWGAVTCLPARRVVVGRRRGRPTHCRSSPGRSPGGRSCTRRCRTTRRRSDGSSRRSRSACLRTPCCRRGQASSRVWPSSRQYPRGRGYTATLLGTVFTHRLFDVIPAMLLVVYVLLTAKIPDWALTSLAIAAAIGGI